MSWQKCPICKGAGLVSQRYVLRAGDYDSWMSSDTMEICKVCCGAGIIDLLPPAHIKDQDEG